jgi:hypothetical protein
LLFTNHFRGPAEERRREPGSIAPWSNALRRGAIEQLSHTGNAVQARPSLRAPQIRTVAGSSAAWPVCAAGAP